MAIPWSHGTLGFLVAAEIRIIPATRFVKLEYIPAYSASEFTRVFAEKSEEREKNHFVEGILFSRHSGVVMTGTLTDTAESGKVRCQCSKFAFEFIQWYTFVFSYRKITLGITLSRGSTSTWNRSLWRNGPVSSTFRCDSITTDTPRVFFGCSA